MAVLLIICTIILIVFAVKWFFRDKELYNFADQIPGPKAFAVIGSSHKFLKKNEQGEVECDLLPRSSMLTTFLFHRPISNRSKHARQIPDQPSD